MRGEGGSRNRVEGGKGREPHFFHGEGLVQK